MAAGISCLVKGLLGSGCFVLICVDLDLSLSVFILGERIAQGWNLDTKIVFFLVPSQGGRSEISF